MDRIITAAAQHLNDRDWLKEQREHEINRLEAILRNPTATTDDRRIATDQLSYWKGQVVDFDTFVKQNWPADVARECTFSDPDHEDCLEENRPEAACCESCTTFSRLAEEFDKQKLAV